MARRRRMVAPTPRRKRVWADFQLAVAAQAEAVSVPHDLLSDYVTAGGSTQGVTVARTLINITWGINQTHTFLDYFTLGLIKGTTTVADQADLITEAYADWAYVKPMYPGRYHSLMTADSANVWEFDVKSQRKIDEIGETWWLSTQLIAPATASATVDYDVRVRTLLLLP